MFLNNVLLFSAGFSAQLSHLYVSGDLKQRITCQII